MIHKKGTESDYLAQLKTTNLKLLKVGRELLVFLGGESVIFTWIVGLTGGEI